MFKKLKMWILTDENREKALLEQEQAERAKNREKVKTPTPSKKDKKKGSKFGNRSRNVEPEDVQKVKTPTTPPPQKTVRKVVVVKNPANEPQQSEHEERPTPPQAKPMSEIQKQMALIEENKEKKRLLKEEEEAKRLAILEIKEKAKEKPEWTPESYTQIGERVESTDVSEDIKDTDNEEKAYESEFMKEFHKQEKERKRIERVRKKAIEMDKYELIMLDLPPTNNMDKVIENAIRAGIPDWYLSEKGYISKEEVTMEAIDMSEFSYEDSVSKVIGDDISIDKLKESLDSDTLQTVSLEHLKETVEEVIDEEIATISKELETIEEITAETVNETAPDVVEETIQEVTEEIFSTVEPIQLDSSVEIAENPTEQSELAETLPTDIIFDTTEEVTEHPTPTPTPTPTPLPETIDDLVNDTVEENPESLDEVILIENEVEETPITIEQEETPSTQSINESAKRIQDLRAKLKGLQQAKSNVNEDYKYKKLIETPKEVLTESIAETVSEVPAPVQQETVIEPLESTSDSIHTEVEVQKEPVTVVETTEEQVTVATSPSPTPTPIPQELKTTITDQIRSALKEKTKAAIEDSFVGAVEHLGNKGISERLKRLAVKREILTIEGNEVFVKEEKDNGSTDVHYKRYSLTKEDLANLSIGSIIPEHIALQVVESKVIIDGEDYDISEAEEREILEEISQREIWVLSTVTSPIEIAAMDAQDSRYVIKAVETEKDFLLAIRSVSNVIVFTQDLPTNLKTNILKYLQYLEKEKKFARIVTLADKPVKAKIIESVLPNLSVESLDNYYKEFPSSRYNTSNKDLISLYKEISFDISKKLESTVEIEVDEPMYADTVSLDNVDLSLNDKIIVNVDAPTSSLDSQKGDIEIDLRHIVQVDSDKMY